jgi:hypothetical protein
MTSAPTVTSFGFIGLAEGIGAMGGTDVMQDIWYCFEDAEKRNTRAVLQWAFEGVAGWHN